MIRFDMRALKNDVAQCSEQQRGILVSCCLTRLLPSYLRTAQMDGLQSANTFSFLLEVLWNKSSLTEWSDSEDFERELEFIALDGDECSHPMSEVAFCASVAMTLAFRSAQRGLTDKAAMVLEQAYLAAKQYGFRKDGPKGAYFETEESEAQEIAHPLVQRELARQKEDLELLKGTPSIDEQFVAQLRAKQTRQDLLEGYV